MAQDEFSEFEEELVQKLAHLRQEYEKVQYPIHVYYKSILSEDKSRELMSDDEFNELIRVSNDYRAQITKIEQTLNNIKEGRILEQKLKVLRKEQAADIKKLKEIQRTIADLEHKLGVTGDTRSQPPSKKYDICKKCNGKGIYIGWFSPSCPRCGGRGIEPGTWSAACSYCGGRKKILETCSECGGKGAFFR